MFVCIATGASACVAVPRPRFTIPAPRREWPSTLELARNMALVGRYGAADSALADFATRYPGTAEALETAYWRALFDLDPTNATASVPRAIATLDAYLAESGPRLHVAEATTLRRVAAQVDALTRVAANAMAEAKDATATAANAKAQASNAKAQASDANARADAAGSSSNDTEVKRLRDELAKANAELERIKKKLSQPPPKP
jgi:hypothetical protein